MLHFILLHFIMLHFIMIHFIMLHNNIRHIEKLKTFRHFIIFDYISISTLLTTMDRK